MDALLGFPVVYGGVALPHKPRIEATWTFVVSEEVVSQYEAGQQGRVSCVCDGGPTFTLPVRCVSVDYEGGVVTFELVDDGVRDYASILALL